jgi:hypothetical protein
MARAWRFNEVDGRGVGGQDEGRGGVWSRFGGEGVRLLEETWVIVVGDVAGEERRRVS